MLLLSPPAPALPPVPPDPDPVSVPGWLLPLLLPLPPGGGRSVTLPATSPGGSIKWQTSKLGGKQRVAFTDSHI